MTGVAEYIEPHRVRTGEYETDLPALVDVFGLGRVVSYDYLATGLMNPNWRLHTDTGVFAVKRIIDVSLDKARRNLAAPAHLASRGVSVASPLPTAGGEFVAELDGGRGYCVLPWVTGEHIDGWQFSVVGAAALGELVARVHQGLADATTELGWPPLPAQVTSRVISVADAVAEANRYLGVIHGIDEPDPFDRSVVGDLLARNALLDIHGAWAPVDDVALGAVGWTHGDLQYRNLLWWDGQIVAVLDWDRVGARLLVEELVRTAQVQLSTVDGELELERVAAFAAGYRSIIDVSDAEIADAAQRLWWKRMTDFWPLQWHYDKQDHSCDELWTAGERVLGWWCCSLDSVQTALTGR